MEIMKSVLLKHFSWFMKNSQDCEPNPCEPAFSFLAQLCLNGCLCFLLFLQVCREFQRGNCKRSETECRFAHPPEHVTVDSSEGTVTVCMDFVKGRCTRDQCRYFHPPAHLQAQLKAAQTRASAAAVVGFSPSAQSSLLLPQCLSIAFCVKVSGMESDFLKNI